MPTWTRVGISQMEEYVADLNRMMIQLEAGFSG